MNNWMKKLAVHFATNFGYDFFRDELYYIQWAERLDWGYVEQPPFHAFVVWVTRAALGESLFALRLPSALFGAGTVLLTSAIARELGGRRLAQGLAGLCVLTAPVLLPLSTDVNGTATLSAPSVGSGMPRGLRIYMQALIVDPTAPNGLFAISNGLLGIAQ